MDYLHFQSIRKNLINLCMKHPTIYPPNETLSFTHHWRAVANFTDDRIYNESGQLIGSENCYFILPCDEDGNPLEPVEILLREWRDIRSYL